MKLNAGFSKKRLKVKTRFARLVSLDLLHIHRVRSLWTFANLELDGVAFFDATLDLRFVNEEVVSAFLFDKSEALREVEPLDRALCHELTPQPLLLDVALPQMTHKFTSVAFL